MKVVIEDGVLRSSYPSVDIPCCSIYEAIKTCVDSSPDQLALMDDSIQLTRAEFLGKSKRYAVGFRAHGITTGDRVCVHVDDSVENLTVMFGLVFAGATLVLCNPSLTERDLLYHATTGDATKLLTDMNNAPKSLSLNKHLNLECMFAFGNLPGAVNAQEFSSTDETKFEEIHVADPRNTVAALGFSSGTTGPAKAIEITHHSFVANLQISKIFLSTHGNDVKWSWYSITYASGFIFITTVACIGHPYVIANPSVPLSRITSIVNKHKVTSISSLPARLLCVANEMLCTGTRFDTVRNISVGGTTLNEAVARRLRAAFPNANLINSYSQTEACGVICFSHKPGSSAQFVGFPAPMVELKFIDVESGKKVGPNEPGELCYKIPSVMRGYYKNPKKMAQFIDEDGWCHSGDLAYYGEDGSVYLVERMENLITCMGKPVIPAELENLLLKHHDNITEVAVVGLPHQKYGQVAAAFIALNKSHRLPEDATREMFLNTVLAKCPMHKHPHGGIYLIDCLPKKSSGKVDQEALKAYALSYDDGRHQELNMSEAYP